MPRTVLIVDDSSAFRSTARMLLQARGYEVVADAQDVATGIQKAAELRPDCVLLDVNLPDGNGLDLAAELADRPLRPRVVALTASVLPHERAAAMSAGCDAFLDKPYAAQDLLDVLTAHLPR